jgi:Fe-S-cluster-containing dehydrogenase component
VEPHHRPGPLQQLQQLRAGGEGRTRRNDFPGYAAPQPLHGQPWLELKRAEHGQAPIVDIVHLPAMCNHCDDAPCVKAGRGAVKKRDDGIVLIDPQAARGRRDLVDACPYGAVRWNEELQLPQHWIFDAHLLDQGWKAPRCAQACPTEAIRAVKVSDAEMAALAADQGLEVLNPELGTRPRVHYRNLKRFTHWVLAGSVVTLRDGVEECVEGAEVTLSHDSQVVARAVTDVFGEYRLRGLEAVEIEYEMEIINSGIKAISLVVNVSHSRSLQSIKLPKSQNEN